MSNVINTNTFSIYAQREASIQQRSEAKAMDRLSSGARVNHAVDDAFGITQIKHQDAQMSGYHQALNNSNDGVSLLQLADGVLGGVASTLQRMRELSVHASTGTLSESQREYLQVEFSQLQQHISKVVEDTTFNGIAIFNRPEEQTKTTIDLQIGGSFSSLVEKSQFQGGQAEVSTKGYYAENSIEADSGSVDEVTLSALPGEPDVGGVLELEVDGIATSQILLDTATRTAAQWADEIENRINSDPSLVAAGVSLAVSYDEEIQRFVMLSDSEGAGSIVKVTNVVNVGALGLSSTDATDPGQREVISMIGVPLEERTITVDVDNQPLVTVELPEEVYPVGSWADYLEKAIDGLKVSYDSDSKSYLFSSLNGSEGTVSVMGDATALGVNVHDTDQLSVPHLSLASTSNAVGKILQPGESISTIEGAMEMLVKVDDAIAYVSAARADYSAVENHLHKVVEKLDTLYAVTADAKSLIGDTDFAAETAELTQQQILRQMSMAMMVQANQLPAKMLQLFN